MTDVQYGIPPVTNEQLYIAIGVPLLINVGFFVYLANRIDNLAAQLGTRIDGLSTYLGARIDNLTKEVHGSLMNHEHRITEREHK